MCILVNDHPKIVALAGSFNPPTIAHLALLLAGVNAVDAQKGLFVPASYNYVRNKLKQKGCREDAIYTDIRRSMLESMAQTDERLFVDMSEAYENASGKVYHTFVLLSQGYPDSEIYFILGSDKLEKLPRWKEITEFIDSCHFLVVSRAGKDLEDVICSSPFLSQHRERFSGLELKADMDDISSTELRKRLREKDPSSADWMTDGAYRILRHPRIYSFVGEYDFLSNFFPCNVEYGGILYHNTEAAFQAQKCLTAEEHLQFAELGPSRAKSLGRHVALRPDWEEVKIRLMEEIVLAKFTQNPGLGEKLLATGDALLAEGNTWNDTFWGVNIRTGEGQNILGKILMKVRSRLL